MTWFLLLVALVVLTAMLRLVATVRRDGLGTRTPPASRAAWTDDVQNLPSRPY
ncbi:hypothetical protein KIN34_14195 [Cellulomonas sp. DKR-3]|uniref:Uncharacterized protein n=1 Tax=Cellulomonas fulva TaxID=2835530 RepID=A0ABS5U224_9CELL|nr:hypothetical protein [Cellulomonas fulva]MBT0995435.1 hypothetical protein [Cellulomonas fulva]